MSAPAPSRLHLGLALAAVWLLWGSTYLGMRFAIQSLPTFLMAGARFLLAGSLVLVVVRLRNEPMPNRRTWLMALPTGALLFLVANGSTAFALAKIPSSIAAVVAATTPLVVSAIMAVRGERPTRVEVLGMVLGLVGVAVLGIGSPLAGAGWRGALILFAPLAWAAGSVLSRAEAARGKGTPGLAGAGANMIAGGFWMLLLGLAVGEHLWTPVTWPSVAAWVYLVTFGSFIGFTAYSWLLANARPAVALSYAYVNPIVAVVLGWLLGGEHLGWATLVATLLIGGGVMASVVLGRRR